MHHRRASPELCTPSSGVKQSPIKGEIATLAMTDDNSEFDYLSDLFYQPDLIS